MARVREVKRFVCNECENTITKCNSCGKWFKDDEKIECQRDGHQHICQECK